MEEKKDSKVKAAEKGEKKENDGMDVNQTTEEKNESKAEEKEQPKMGNSTLAEQKMVYDEVQNVYKKTMEMEAEKIKASTGSNEEPKKKEDRLREVQKVFIQTMED